MNLYAPPGSGLDLPAPLLTARRIGWLILSLCVVVAVGGVLWLAALYIASVVQLPDLYAHIAKSISETQDISVLKSACLLATRLDEADLLSRRNWIVIAPTLAFVLAVAVGALSVWLLLVLRRIERLIESNRGIQVG